MGDDGVDFLGIGYDDTQNDQAQNRSDGIGPDYDNYFHHATMQVSSHPPGHEQHQQPEVATQEPLQREKRFHQAAPYTTSGTIPLTTEPISASIQADADSARLRAMEVVRKFQRPNHYNDNNDTGRNQGGRGSRSKNYQFDPYFDPYAAVELGRKRKECLELLKARERVALLKNLEYLSRVEDERLQERLLKIQQAQELERHMELQHKRRHESNARTGIGVNSRQSQAGIGTQQRQRVQEEQRNQYGPAAKRNEFASESVAIYVANLPRDGSADEELMRGLFSSYGNIRKIHFYVDKRTGQRKGDALVIYSLQQGQDRSALTESVCSQVNGCELPGGEILVVEPSDPSHKLRKKASSPNHYGPASETTEEQNTQQNTTTTTTNESIETGNPTEENGNQAPSTKVDGDEDDNLDDFFASLE